jgi:hypothetical protein
MIFGAVDWFLRDEYWINEGGRKTNTQYSHAMRNTLLASQVGHERSTSITMF